MPQTKIIATLGPASKDEGTISALVAAGVDVFRLNFSHGTHAEHASSVERVRRAAAAQERQIAVLQDLSGPKIRTGRLEGRRAVSLAAGDHLNVAIGDDVGGAGRVFTTYAPLAQSVKTGDRLLLDDGRIELEVEAVRDLAFDTRVVVGGVLGEHKGINAPNVPLPAVGITEKDAVDLRFGLEAGVDMVALSFVQSAADLRRARELIEAVGRKDVPLIAKLERPEAIAHLDEVLAASDAVMVARGDLGLELPLERVPRVQKEVLRVARAAGVPVIVATQVLESMRVDPRPTRAEVSDAAGAVDAGADAIMLSGETAIGAYPVRSAEVLDRIITDAESMPPAWSLSAPSGPVSDHVPALCDAAVTLANRGQVEALVAITRKGRTARLLSARRPRAPIYAATDRPEVARRLALWWGVVPMVTSLEGTVDSVSDRILALVRRIGLRPQSRVVFVNASPDLDQSGANFLKLRQV